MKKIDELIVVEGKHDADTVLSVFDASVMATDGFGIFKNDALASTLRDIGRKRGVVILTDSDRAGFAIRRRLEDVIGKENVKHVYVPDIFGKERRKKKPSKEGKLGVEGMSGKILEKAFEDAGITESAEKREAFLTKALMYEKGLSGRDNSSKKCLELKKMLGLPENLSVNRLICVLNILIDKQKFEDLVRSLPDCD